MQCALNEHAAAAFSFDILHMMTHRCPLGLALVGVKSEKILDFTLYEAVTLLLFWSNVVVVIIVVSIGVDVIVVVVIDVVLSIWFGKEL